MSEIDDIKPLPATLQGEGTPSSSGEGYLSGFGNSFIQSLGQGFGVSKSPEVVKWEAENPVSGTISSLGGSVVPFLVPEYAIAKNAKLAGKLEDLTTAITGGEASRPILSAATREALKFAPVAGAQLTYDALAGDRPLGDVAVEAGLNLGISALAGAGFQALKEYGRGKEKLSALVPGASDELPPQLQMRMAKEVLDKGELPANTALDIQNRLAQFQRAVRMEDVPFAGRYVGQLEGGVDGKDLSRLFVAEREGKGIVKKKFVTGEFGFKDTQTASAATQMEDVWKAAGYGKLEDSTPFVQYPRYVEAKTAQTAAMVQKIAVQGKLTNVSDKLWMGREAGDRLYVMATKVKGDAGKSAAGDSWLLFKTDTPGRFAPLEEAWAGKAADKQAWTMRGGDSTIEAASGAHLMDYANDTLKKFPVVNYLGMGGTLSKGAAGAEQMIKHLGLDKTLGGAKEAFGDFFNRYFVPAQYQFGSSPRANWINGMSRAIYDKGGQLAHEVFYGKHALQGGNLFDAALKGAKPVGGGIKTYLSKLAPADLDQVWSAWHNQMGMKELEQAYGKGDLSKVSFDFLKKLDEVDTDQIKQIQATQAPYGEKLFQPKKNHFMISRTWVGGNRVQVFNDAGKLVYMASGKTARQAELQAEKIVAANAGWSKGSTMLADRLDESPVKLAGYFDEMALNRDDYFKAAKVVDALKNTRAPNFMEQRKGVGGFLGQHAAWNKEELEKILLGHLQSQNNYLSTLVVNNSFASDLFRLRAENPQMFQTLNDRLLDLQGKPGPLAVVQNKLVDKVLAPVLGPNSASKIVRTTNELMLHLNLGGLNFAQPIMNMVGFMQTVVPEIAFALNAVPERLGWAYGVWPLANGKGMIDKAVHVLDPLKIMRRSAQEMRKPSAELYSHFERAANDGIISPRMVEDYIGESAAKVTDLKRAISSGGGFVDWMKSVSESLLSGTEKLSRGNAFTVGHIVGRDFFNLQDEQLYQFAKKFTQRTMYGYSTADRARVFTTPAGSALGLFKNWMTHYMGSMLEYTGEGVMRNNWSPLLWQLGGTAAIGGVAATGPMYYMADQFSKMANNKSLMDNTYELFGNGSKGLLAGEAPSVSDAVFFGLPTFFGTSLSSSGTAPGTNPARDATMMFSFVQMDRANAIAKAVGTAIDVAHAQGGNALGNAQVQDQFVRAFAPKTVYRVAAAWNDKAINSLTTTAPNLKDVSLAERVMYMSGLNPTYVERQFRVADELWNDKQKMQAEIKAAGMTFYQAQKAGDYHATNDIIIRAVANGIDPSRILRVSANQYKRENKDMLEAKFSVQERMGKPQ